MLDDNGVLTSIAKAPRVPTVFKAGSDFSGCDFTQDREYNRRMWCAPIKEQPLKNAQFTHPTHMVADLDETGFFFVTHDSFRLFHVDLDGGKLLHVADINRNTALDDSAMLNKQPMSARPEVLKQNWPTLHMDRAGQFGRSGMMVTCAWHAESIKFIMPDGKFVRFEMNTETGTCGDHPGVKPNAYPEAVIFSQSQAKFAWSADGQSQFQAVRPRRADDPTMDLLRYRRGDALYKADGIKADGTPRAALMTLLGANGKHYWDELKTLAEMELMDDLSWKQYMLDTFKIGGWSEQSWSEYRPALVPGAD